MDQERRNKIEEVVKAVLFGRHLALCYADSHMDKTGKTEHDEGFDPSTAISVLNRENSYFYLEVWKHFNQVALPNMIKNNTFEEHVKEFHARGILSTPDWSITEDKEKRMGGLPLAETLVDQWAIMSKDRKFIAAGATRNRSLISVEELKAGTIKKRILLYGTEGKARTGFKNVGFYGEGPMMEAAIPGYKDMDWHTQRTYDKADYLEAVKLSLNY